MGDPEVRAELRELASSLRAHLGQQKATGVRGLSGGSGSRSAPAALIPAGPSLPFTAPFTAVASTAPEELFPTTPAAPAVRAQPVVPSPPSAERSVRLPMLAEEVAGCTRCSELAATRTQTVFFRGSPEASLCFVGEAPGADEDAQGLPFVGRAGQLLDKMISAMGLDPSRDVYVCNILKCRPPDNRRPTPQEVASCIPYLHEQLSLVRPKVIVALGNTSVAALLGTKLGISKVRGSWKLYKGTTLVMPTYHPSYLLRPSAQQAEAKKQTWEDLQMVMHELGIASRRATRHAPDS